MRLMPWNSDRRRYSQILMATGYSLRRTSLGKERGKGTLPRFHPAGSRRGVDSLGEGGQRGCGCHGTTTGGVAAPAFRGLGAPACLPWLGWTDPLPRPLFCPPIPNGLSTESSPTPVPQQDPHGFCC